MSRLCPKCGQDTMPAIERGSQATARACQNCRHVEEIPMGQVNALVAKFDSLMPGERERLIKADIAGAKP
jgi:hypothetical protein